LDCEKHSNYPSVWYEHATRWLPARKEHTIVQRQALPTAAGSDRRLRNNHGPPCTQETAAVHLQAPVVVNPMWKGSQLTSGSDRPPGSGSHGSCTGCAPQSRALTIPSDSCEATPLPRPTASPCRCGGSGSLALQPFPLCLQLGAQSTPV